MSTVVSKNVQIGADGTASNNFTAYQPATPDGTLRIGNGNSGSVTDAITLTSAGNVGIGTSSPTLGKLHILASGTSDASMENVAHFGKNSTSRAGLQISANATEVDVGLQAQVGAGNIALTFSSLASGSNIERMRITSAGNVGIGTTSPENKLTIVKNTTAATENSYGIAVQSVSTNGYTELLLGASDAVDAGIIQTAAKNTNFTAKNLALQPQGGNVGIGTTSVGTNNGSVGLKFGLKSAQNNIISGESSGSNFNGIILESRKTGRSVAERYAQIQMAESSDNGLISFYTAPSGSGVSERARIDSSGNLLVGRTSQFLDGQYSSDFNGNSKRGATYNNTFGNSGANFISFGSAGTQIGGVSQSGGSAVLYNTSSDYRLKENVVDVTGASARVQQLNPVRFNFISDPYTTVDGFLSA
jgi:hypothetical protein